MSLTQAPLKTDQQELEDLTVGAGVLALRAEGWSFDEEVGTILTKGASGRRHQ